MSDNQLTALPAEWTAGFANATQSSFVNIFLQQNQIQVCFLISTLLTYIQLMSSASNMLQFCHLAAIFLSNKDKVVVKWQRQCTAVLARAMSCVQCLFLPGIAAWQGEYRVFIVCCALFLYDNITGCLLNAMSPAGHVDDALPYISKAQ